MQQWNGGSACAQASRRGGATAVRQWYDDGATKVRRTCDECTSNVRSPFHGLRRPWETETRPRSLLQSMLVVSDREAISRCVAEYEALRSGAASSLFHRQVSRDGELEWCGSPKDRRHWTCTRVRDDAATPIVVGDFEVVRQVPNELSQRRRLADVAPPTIVFGGRRRHLEAARGACWDLVRATETNAKQARAARGR